jgi:4-amino-4-deoxy-L-arabinose transferase-like glycosyltransferase
MKIPAGIPSSRRFRDKFVISILLIGQFIDPVVDDLATAMYTSHAYGFSSHRGDISIARWRSLIALLMLLTLGSGLVMIDSLPLDSHEIFVAQTTQEMAARADWIVPYFNGEPRLNKPPLSYWAAGLVAKFSGSLPNVSAWQVRVISVIAGLGVLGCTVLTARLLFDRMTALVAGALLAASAGMFSYMHDARPDMLYAFWISVQIAAAAGLVQTSNMRGRSTAWIAYTLWLGTALATLTKGPHVPVLVLIGLALGLRQTYGSWRRVRSVLRPWTGLVLVLAVCCPWWWLLREHLNTAQVQASQLGGTLLAPAISRFGDPYYLYRPLQLLLPWLPLIAVAVAGYRRPVARQGLAILIWPLAITIIGLSLGRQYRYFYLLPLLGVLAIVVARPWICTLRAILTRAERGLILTAFVLQALVLLGCAGWVIQHTPAVMFNTVAVLLLGSLVVAAVIWRAVPGPRAMGATVAMAAAMIFIWSAAGATGALWDRERYESHRLAELARAELPLTSTLATYGISPTIYVYYLQRAVRNLTRLDEVEPLRQLSAQGELGLVLRDRDLAVFSAHYGVTELGRYRRGDADDVLVVLRAQAAQ